MSLFWLSFVALALPVQGQQPGRCRPPTVIDCPEHFYAAPGTASPSGKAAVAQAIQAALDARVRRKKSEDTLGLLALYVKNPSRDPDKRPAKELNALFYAAQHSRKFAEDEEFRLFNAAIAAALPAYGLTPPQTSIPDSPRGKETEPWKPRFSKLEIYDDKTKRWIARSDDRLKEEAREAERAVVRVDGKEVAFGVFGAQTWPDGRISMHWVAFVSNIGDSETPVYVPDPDALAGLIAHETVHWVMGQGRQNYFSSQMNIFYDFSIEAAAYAAQAKLLQKQGNPAAPDYFAFSKQYSEQARKVESMSSNVTWDDIQRLHPDWLPVGGHGTALRPGVPPPSEPGESDGLEWARERSGLSFTESLGSLGELAADARRVANSHSTGREAERERDREARRARWAQEDVRQSEVWEYLVATAKVACTDPDALEEQVRLKRVVGADANSLYLMNRLAQTQASGWDNVGKGLSACQQTLINRLLRNRGPVAIYDLLAWARDYRRNNPSLGENISGALNEFFGAIGRVSQPGPGASPSETTPPPQNESPRQEPDGGAYEPPRPPRERDSAQEAERSGINVPPCREVGGGWRCIRW